MELTQNLPLHEDRRNYRMANWVLFVGCPLLLLVFGILFWIRIDPGSGLTVIAVSAIISLLFWFVSPRKYRIYNDHLAIQYARPITLHLPYASIISVEKSDNSLISELAGAGPKPYVHITTKNRPDYYAFPDDVDAFFTETTKALETWRSR